MKNSKLVKVYKKHSLREKVIGRVALVLGSFVTLFLILEDFPTELFTTLSVLVCGIFLLLQNMTNHSTIQLHENYMICHNPFFFWKYKKLFYYVKIDYISIYRVSSDEAYGTKVYLLDGQVFSYRVDVEQVDDFVRTLRKLNVRVSIDIRNYQTATTN